MTHVLELVATLMLVVCIFCLISYVIITTAYDWFIRNDYIVKYAEIFSILILIVVYIVALILLGVYHAFR